MHTDLHSLTPKTRCVAAPAVPMSDARTLQDAFELVSGLRLEHQIGQLRAGNIRGHQVERANVAPLLAHAGDD